MSTFWCLVFLSHISDLENSHIPLNQRVWNEKDGLQEEESKAGFYLKIASTSFLSWPCNNVLHPEVTTQQKQIIR